MSETLEAIYDGLHVGTMSYANDKLAFAYADKWRNDPAAFPLSMSMPLARTEHPDKVVRPFISGLLPDDIAVLNRWGQKFHVSPRNPFRLLAHVGEECAGAIQFVPPERASDWLIGSPPEGIDWLGEEELVERIGLLLRDSSEARQHGDEGQFSLAGAQAKTALYLQPKSGRWGIPKGATPTTHIIKPSRGDFACFEINEHFCLRLAARLGLRTASSKPETIGEHRVIVVERYDRIRKNDRLVRVHQEDFCQALAIKPEDKYQNQNGPSAKCIFEVIREHSSSPKEDEARFLDAMILNYLIGGTDAHAKNYGLLIAGGGLVRFAPLYDLISILPYKTEKEMEKVKLAMKIGGKYGLRRIGCREWEKAAEAWKLDPGFVRERIKEMAKATPAAATTVNEQMQDQGEVAGKFANKLTDRISERAESCLQEFDR